MSQRHRAALNVPVLEACGQCLAYEFSINVGLRCVHACVCVCVFSAVLSYMDRNLSRKSKENPIGK